MGRRPQTSTVRPLRHIRVARTLSQHALARLMGVSQQTLSKWERGLLEPSSDMQIRLAAVLGVSVADAFPPAEAGVHGG